MRVKLGELGKIITGNTPKTSETENYNSNDICFIKPSDISENDITYIYKSEFYLSEIARDKARILPQNSLLVTCIGIIGKVAINKVECAFNQQINAIIPNVNKCLPNYLAYTIQYKKDEIQKIANTAVVPILNKTQFSNIEVFIPRVEEQQKIAAVLDKVSDLIALRKKQLEKLEELVKARFVEMFGDPIYNSQHFPTTEFVNVVTLQRGYDLPVYNRNSGGLIPIYGANGILDYHNEAKSRNGVITGRSGTIGKVYYCEGFFWPLNTTLFSIDNHGNNVIYLAYLLQYFNLKRFYDGTGVPTLNRNIIHKKQIINIPIELQEQFANFVTKVDKQKLTIQKSLDKLEILKKALMQEYFG